ncbi:MAG: hypothetical protein ACOVNL_03320 [Prochlorococcaceae cyanobacterium]|jgi:hypothetical protein
MTDPLAASGFSPRRTRSFARLTAYTLLSLFLISALAAFLPPPFGRPERLFPVLGELLAERSPLPLLALILLFAGFGGDTAPALWEARLVPLLRPLLRFCALLYLLTAVALVAVTGQLQGRGSAQLSGQLDAALNGIAAFRSQVRAAPDTATLRQQLEAQPPLRAMLADPSSALADAGAPLLKQRQAALQLLDRVEANLRADNLRQRADAGGTLQKESLRLVLTALVYAGFYLLASALWPRSAGPLLDRARAGKASTLLAHDEAGDQAR